MPPKYVATADKLCKRGLLAAGSVPTLADVEPRLVKKYWPRASFTFELRPLGELGVKAEVKGQCVWEGGLRLDEALRRRAEGAETIDVGGLEVGLGALLDLLDSKFFMKRAR